MHENGDNQVYITISEGKFHQVKRMFKAVNNESSLFEASKNGKSFAGWNLKLGEYRELTEEELDGLKFWNKFVWQIIWQNVLRKR